MPDPPAAGTHQPSARERVANDNMASLLTDCAQAVRKGLRSETVRRTLHDLTDWYAADTPVAAAVSQQQISKPVKPPHFASVLGKMGGLGGEQLAHEPKRSQASKQATSSKNAARVKADLAADLGGLAVAASSASTTQAVQAEQDPKAHKPTRFAGHHEEDDWCEVHFTMGCTCKNTHGREVLVPKPSSPTASATKGTSVASSSDDTATVSAATVVGTHANKPAFQRPVNNKSSLIANGWLEQQRRSKMRTIWKDVLASLVQGRKPGEETTLWIQREVVDSAGVKSLEVLHQIPVKWVQDVLYLDYSADHRFSVRVHNMQEEFIFRCARDDEAAQNWVLTLRSAQENAQRKAKHSSNGQTNGAANRTGVDDWDATTQRKGFEDEKKVPDKQQYPSVVSSSSTSASPDGGPRTSVKELRAIAHGAGVNTYGMERGDLETIVQQITMAHQQPSGPPRPSPPTARPGPPGQSATAAAGPNRVPSDDAAVERRRQEAAAAAIQEQQRRHQAQTRRQEDDRTAAVERAATERKAEEEHRSRLADRVKERQEVGRRRRQDEERKKMEEERMKRDAEELRKRAVEKRAVDLRRREEEARRQQQAQWQQQQQAWQKQQAEEEQRRHHVEQQAAEERRRQEEAFRHQHQQQQQQWHHQQQQQQQHQQQKPQWHQPQQPQQGFQQYPNTPGAAPRNLQSPPQQQPSPVNLKYAKMAHQTDDNSQMAIHSIKHGVLVKWALQPPMLQVLRSIEDLITSIHTVFPPQFNIPAHDYFSKWSPITHEEVNMGPAMGKRPDDEKLKKAIKKLRFFLHPDKLPRDLNKEQTFVCKMLWDITSDAWEDHKKKEEDLGWIRG